jgi:hypothetical protein
VQCSSPCVVPAAQHLKQPIFRRKGGPHTEVEVNFHGDLIELIRETRYLDRMGFPIPEIALNVALQVGVGGGLDPRLRDLNFLQRHGVTLVLSLSLLCAQRT